VDVRSATEFASGHIPGAVNIPLDQIEARSRHRRFGELPLIRAAASVEIPSSAGLRLAGCGDERVFYVIAGRASSG